MKVILRLIVLFLLLGVCCASCSGGYGCTCPECYAAGYSYWCDSDSVCSSYVYCLAGCSGNCVDDSACSSTPSPAALTPAPGTPSTGVCSSCSSGENYICEMTDAYPCSGTLAINGNPWHYYCCTSTLSSACSTQCSSAVQSCSGSTMSCPATASPVTTAAPRVTPSPPTPSPLTPSPPTPSPLTPSPLMPSPPSSTPSVGVYCGTAGSSRYVIQITDSSHCLIFGAFGNNNGCSATGTYTATSSGVFFTMSSPCLFLLTSLTFNGDTFSGAVDGGISNYVSASASGCINGNNFSPSSSYYCTYSDRTARLVTGSSSFSLMLSSGGETCTMSGYYVIASDTTTFTVVQSLSPSQCSTTVSQMHSSYSDLVWTLNSVGAGYSTLKLSSSGCMGAQQPPTPSPSSSSTTAIIGGVVGGVVAVGAAVGLIVYFKLIRKPPAPSQGVPYEMLFMKETAKAEML